MAAFGDSYLYNPRTNLSGVAFLKDVYRPFGFSANGRYFLYLKAIEGRPAFSLFKYDLNDGTDEPVTTRKVFSAAWPAQGTDIAYLSMESATQFTLFVHESGSNRSRKIDEGMLDPDSLAWSADGRQILYSKLTPKSDNYFEDGLLDRSEFRYDTGSEAVIEDATGPFLEQLPNGETVQSIRHSRGQSGARYVRSLGNGRVVVKRWNPQADSYDVASAGSVYAETQDGLVIRDFTAQGVNFQYVSDVSGDSTDLRTIRRPLATGPSAGGERAQAAAFSAAWKLPFGGAAQLDQGGALFSGGACDGRSCQIISHNNRLGYALDWTQRPAQGPARLLAPEEGTVAAVVTTVTCNSIKTACTNTVDAYASPCPNTGGAGNYVVLAHADGSFTFYGHMRSFSSPLVVGQTVLPGDYLGDQGHTGSAGSSIVPCGDHLHYQRQVGTAVWAQSIPTDFTELPCQLSCTTSYTSQNLDRSAPQSVSGLTVSLIPNTAAVGSSSPSSRVILPSLAPTGGTLVTLTSSSPDVSAPAAVLIAEGTTFAAFSVSVAATTTVPNAIITAQADTQTATATLTVKKIAIQSLTLSPTSVIGGNTTTANEVTLSEMPGQDMPLAASSSKTAATVPSTVTIPAGNTFTQFPIQTTLVSAAVTAGITVSNGNSSKTSNLQVNALVPLSLSITSPVIGGNSATATLTMNGSVGTAPAVVSITSSDPAVVVPATVTVDAATSSKSFTVSTAPVASVVTATITATFNGVSKSATFTVNPLMVSSISLGSLSVFGGANVGGNFITLNAPATSEDVIVALSSSDPAAAPVPATITVPAGAAQSLAFAIPTTTATTTTQVSITATFNGISKTAVLSVNPLVVGQTVWNSYDATTQSGTPQATVVDMSWQKTATVELYQSTNTGGVDKGSLFATFTAGVHPGAFNRVQNYWSATGGNTYPYAGKSTVERGLDTGETNPQAPGGVFDLQLHPPNSGNLAVAAFRIPEDGNYRVSNLAVRRVDGTPTNTVRYRVFNSLKVQLSNLQATNDRAWVTDPNTYPLGQLTAGQYIYFAVDRDGNYSYDATEISWTVTEIALLPDFALSATPATQSVATGGGTSFTTTSTAQNGFTGTIGFSVSGLPAGTTADFSPASVTDGGTTTLNITTGSATAGTYPLTITASSGSLTHTANVTLVITGPPDFTFAASPASGSVPVGGTTTFTLTTTAQNGFTDIVGFSASGLPVGATDSYSPATVTGSGSSTLTITTGSGVSPGTYPLTITATSGALTHTFPVSLTVAIPQPSITWNSYDVVTQAGTPQATVTDTLGVKTATVELYQSTNTGGVNKGSLFATFTAGAHPGAFNRVQNYWSATGGNTYPYAGKSTVGRGLDTGETNAPAPSGVFDLQLHPPNVDNLVVTAFLIPENGTYQVSNLAVRRVDGTPTNTVRYRVFNSLKVQLSNLQATNNRAWVTNPNTYDLGQLTAGQYIYFAVARDGTYAYDATEISWTVTKTGP